MKPYIEESVTTIIRKYNPEYGDDRICQCGHSYYRHFDSYDEMANIGCKYCYCRDFQEADMSPENIEKMRIVVKENNKTLDIESFIDYNDPRSIQLIMEYYFQLQWDK
jgi:hypothetical protein